MRKNIEQRLMLDIHKFKEIFLLHSVNGFLKALWVCLYCSAASKRRKEITPLTEDQKIRQILNQYSSYFEHSDADVGHTQKGVWFFYEYDEEHDYYNSFIRFSTAKELEQLIASLLTEDFNILIEVGAEDVHHALRKIQINDAVGSCYAECIPILLKNIEVLNSECQKWAEKLDVIYQSFSGVLERLQSEN